MSQFKFKEFEFLHVCDIIPELNIDGTANEYFPQKYYKNKNNHI